MPEYLLKTLAPIDKFVAADASFYMASQDFVLGQCVERLNGGDWCSGLAAKKVPVWRRSINAVLREFLGRPPLVGLAWAIEIVWGERDFLLYCWFDPQHRHARSIQYALLGLTTS